MRSAFSVAVYIAHILLACYNKEKGVRDFSRTSKQKWETQIESVVDKLSKTHKQIYVCWFAQ